MSIELESVIAYVAAGCAQAIRSASILCRDRQHVCQSRLPFRAFLRRPRRILYRIRNVSRRVSTRQAPRAVALLHPMNAIGATSWTSPSTRLRRLLIDICFHSSLLSPNIGNRTTPASISTAIIRISQVTCISWVVLLGVNSTVVAGNPVL